MPPPTASSAPPTNPPKVLSDPTDQNPAVDEVAGAVKGAVPPVTVDGHPKAEVELGTAAWCLQSNRDVLSHDLVQIPTRIPEKIVVALFSGILVISGILVVAGILFYIITPIKHTHATCFISRDYDN